MTNSPRTNTPNASSPGHALGSAPEADSEASASARPPGPLSRALRLAASLLELTLLGALVCWLTGRVVSDRFLWSQYLGWIPTEAIALLAVGVLIAGVLLRRSKPRVLVTIATLGVVGWLALAEWRLYRAVVPSPDRGDLRVLFMNISPRGRDASLDPLFATGADLAVLSNVHPQPVTFEKIYGVRHRDLLERFTGRVPGDAPPGEAHLVRYGMFHIYSKLPIRRRASAHVGNQETWLENDTGGGGAVLMLEIETPQGPMTVWALDMPSTLGASRRSMFEEARAKVDDTSRALAIDSIGRWVTTDLEPGDPLLRPDLIVGDFNTPGHAWSVERFAAGARTVRADAGMGPPGTFIATAPYPLFEIDLARLGDGVAATHLEKVRAPGCRHLGLMIDLNQTSDHP